jgi:alpha-D-xyloside xylohydrolase
MVLAFPDDLAVEYLDRQYMFGSDLLVAPVFRRDGVVDVYLPSGQWTDLWTGRVVEGGTWRREKHSLESLPVYVRPGALIPFGVRSDRPDHDYADGLVLLYADGPQNSSTLELEGPGGTRLRWTVERQGDGSLQADGPSGIPWSLQAGPVAGPVAHHGGRATVSA